MEQAPKDWRMHLRPTVAKDTRLAWNNQLVPAGTQITLVSVIPLSKRKTLTIAVPNATALMVNCSARSWSEAKEIRTRNGFDKSKKAEQSFSTCAESFDYIERVMEAVITAFSGIEAFVNETIPDSYQYTTNRRSETILEVMSKGEIERYLSIEEKLSSVLPTALSVKSPKGSSCWRDLKDLKRTRDRLIHMKAGDRRSSGPDNPTLWHHLFKIPCPHKQALSVMDYFFRASGAKPLWRQEYPL